MTKLILFNKARDKLLIFMALSVFCMSVFDAWATFHGLTLGWFTEANPIMGYFISLGSTAFYVTKLSITGLALAFLWVMRERQLARVGYLLVFVGYLMVTSIHIWIYLSA